MPVNALPQALASTSADPGHTQSFFCYRVNKGRGGSPAGVASEAAATAASGLLEGPPEFRLVDVPGVGYTSEASGVDTGDRASWRGLLERYMTVRAGLAVVFHLVDAKAGLQPADFDLLKLAASALTNRKNGEGTEARLATVKYVLVLTKADKVTSLEAQAQAREVQACAAQEFAAATAAAADVDSDGGAGEHGRRGLTAPQVIVTSAKARPPLGRDRLWECLVETLLEEKEQP